MGRCSSLTVKCPLQVFLWEHLFPVGGAALEDYSTFSGWALLEELGQWAG